MEINVHTQEFVVEAEQAGERLDRYLTGFRIPQVPTCAVCYPLYCSYCCTFWRSSHCEKSHQSERYCNNVSCEAEKEAAAFR